MILTVDKLVKRYKDKIALDHFNLKLEEGEILGLLGPNGCGKTTAINSILGLLKYDKGSIEIFSRKMESNSYEIKRDIGLVPQEISVLGTLTVYENIDYFCGLYIEDNKLRKDYVDQAIDFVGLGDYRKSFPRELSGGLRRRLNIACGISHKPKLLFLDEPTVAVDAQSRNFILDGIKELNKNGTSIIYTSHYLEEVERICSRVVIMDKGRDIVSGTKEELKDMIDIKEKIILELVEDIDFIDEINSLPGLIDVERVNRDYIIKFQKGHSNLYNLARLIEENQLSYNRLYSELPSLNDVFLEMTGKELRD